MNLFITLLTALLALVVGYIAAALRYQRAAIRAETALEAARAETDHALAEQAKALREEFKHIADETIRNRSEELRLTHIHSLDALLKPLGKDIENFKTQFVAGHASLDRYIRQLVERTTALGEEADALARALKGNTKLQGNWGELVLDNLLQASGLTPGRDYTVQQRTPSEDGTVAIPDVVVHLPENRHLIIDSKVSLNAYTEYVAEEDRTRSQSLLRDHVRSVRNHIRELSEKHYEKLVPGCIGYVLMFIPGEGAFMAAMNAEPLLPTEAYARRIILINPTNLLMALQLAYNLRQSELQSRSAGEIVMSAEKLYKKFATFSRNFVKIGTSITQLQRTFEEAQGQLSTGRGNIISQLEGWKKKGITPTSEIAPELTTEGKQTEESE